jgi:hypothetical protein
MLKKIVFIAITVMVIGTAVAPLVQAQDMKKLEALEKELEKLEAKIDKGQQLTPKEIQRIQEIHDEVMMLMANSPYGGLIQQYQGMGGNNNYNSLDGERQVQQIQQMNQQALQQQQMMEQMDKQQQKQEEERKMYPGKTRGWPTVAYFKECFKNYPQIATATLKQPVGTNASYTDGVIYLTGGNANTVLQNLKQQVEKITGKQMDIDGGQYFVFIQDSNRKDSHLFYGFRFWLRIEDNIVVLTMGTVAG